MDRVPRLWHARKNRDPERELLQLRSRFESVSYQLDRPRRLKRLARHAGILILCTTIGAGGYVAIERFSPWPVLLTLRHWGSLPDCAAARLMGLAPARRGEPGYWPKHDADNDGIACEPWPK